MITLAWEVTAPAAAAEATGASAIRTTATIAPSTGTEARRLHFDRLDFSRCNAFPFIWFPVPGSSRPARAGLRGEARRHSDYLALYVSGIGLIRVTCLLSHATPDLENPAGTDSYPASG